MAPVLAQQVEAADQSDHQQRELEQAADAGRAPCNGPLSVMGCRHLCSPVESIGVADTDGSKINLDIM
jgi:hypothetical protein